MIQQEGYLTLIRRNSGKLTNADFDQAKKEGCLKELIESCDLDDVHGPQRNLICHSFAGSLFPRLFYSANVNWEWWWGGTTAWSFLVGAVLASIDVEPAVTDQNPSNDDYWVTTPQKVNNWGYGAVYISHKWFEESQAEVDEIKSSPLGREDIYYRERWLWAPSDFTSSNIRSFAILTGHPNAVDSSGAYYGKGGHIRLKDANGLPVIYSKTANQILLAEYKFILASV